MYKNFLFTSIPDELESYLLKSTADIDCYVFAENKKTDSYEYEHSSLKNSKKKNTQKITKEVDNDIYNIVYDYDDLGRVNSRTVFKNNKIIFSQKYYFDILDRISEYKDNYFRVYIFKISDDQKLLYYRITDIIGNEISVENIMTENLYQNTNITLNGHSCIIYDKKYLENKILVKPDVSIDDMDLCISYLLGEQTYNEEKIIKFPDLKVDIKLKYLPFTVRKLALIMN